MPGRWSLAGNNRLTAQPPVSLARAFELADRELVSLAGGGGKSTIMHALATELAVSGKRVITTTTTRILPWQAPGLLVIEEDEADLFEKAVQALANRPLVSLGRKIERGEKLTGISPGLADRVSSVADYVIVEADGAGCKPIKAPNATEPVFPQLTSLVVAVIGIDCLGKTLSGAVFRPEIASGLTGAGLDTPVTSGIAATLLLHPQGITKGSPPSARRVVFINKVETPEELVKACEIAELLSKQAVFSHVIIGKARDPNPVLKVITLG